MTRKITARQPTAAPVFKDLEKREVESILAGNHVGRIAFSFHDAVDIRPIHYVFDDGWLFGRTSLGDKLVALQHNQWVAFEVDEVSGPFDWKSVVAHGSFYHLDPSGVGPDALLYARGIRAVKALLPDALTDKDPLPFRTELFGISMDSVTGRSCATRLSPEKSPGRSTVAKSPARRGKP